MSEELVRLLEGLSYLITIVGLPFAILVFIYEQRKERHNEDEEIWQRLSDEYADFLRLVLENADLQLMGNITNQLTAEQIERRNIIFEILISLFERAYILVYEDKMDKQTARLWLSWEDYMRYWCRRDDFRAQLPALLQGEDIDFQKHIQRIADEERQRVSGRASAAQ
jgi:hypothetical protein